MVIHGIIQNWNAKVSVTKHLFADGESVRVGSVRVGVRWQMAGGGWRLRDR